MKKILLSFAALAALVSCVKETPIGDETLEQTPAQTQSISFEAVAPSSSDEADTKTTLVDHSLVHWSKGDAVKVLFIPNAGYGATIYETDQTIGANAVMTATFESESSASAFFTVDDFSWGHGIKYMMDSGIALYPATVNASSIRPKGNYMYANTTTITYDLPSVQEAVENSFKSGVLFSYAKIENKTDFATNQSKLNFKNGCALVKITLPDNAADIVSVKVESANADLAGEKKVTDMAATTQMPNFDSEGRLGALSAVNTVKHITLSAPAGETLKAGASYYIVAWPGEHNSLTFTFTNSIGLTSSKTSGAVSLVASEVDHFNFKNPITFEHVLEVSNESFKIDGDATTGSFTVTSSRAWTSSSSADWLTVSPASGEASVSSPAIVRFSAATNVSVSERTAQITITSGDDTKTITVSQAGFVPEITLSTSSMSFEAAGSSSSFSVTSNVYWTVSSDQSWLTLSPTAGSASSYSSGVTVTVAENTEYEERTATISVTGQGVTKTISVTQAAAVKTSGFKVVGPVLPEELETGKYYVIANYGDPTKYWTVADDGFYSLSLTGGFSTNEYSNEFGPEHIFTVSSISKDVNIGDSNYNHTAQVNLFSMLSNKGLFWVGSSKTYRCNNAWGVTLNMGARWGGDTDNSVDIIDPNNRDSDTTTIDYINTPDGSKITCVSGYDTNNNGPRKWLIFEVK